MKRKLSDSDPEPFVEPKQDVGCQSELKNIWLQLTFKPKFDPFVRKTTETQTDVDVNEWNKFSASWEKYMILKSKVRYGQLDDLDLSMDRENFEDSYLLKQEEKKEKKLQKARTMKKEKDIYNDKIRELEKVIAPLRNKCELLEETIRDRAERDAEERKMNRDKDSMFRQIDAIDPNERYDKVKFIYETNVDILEYIKRDYKDVYKDAFQKLRNQTCPDFLNLLQNNS